MKKVQKRDGSLENFDRSKIVSGVTKAGGSQQDGENVASQIEGWAASVTGDTINVVELRTKVLEILRAVNPSAAIAFEGYKKA